ncbi:hypothetical protein GQ472_04840 [archaeon]|nr:hypothetical protein [archaeon]
MPEAYHTKANVTYEKGEPWIPENLQDCVETDIYIAMPPVSTSNATVHITAIIKGEPPLISPC